MRTLLSLVFALGCSPVTTRFEDAAPALDSGSRRSDAAIMEIDAGWPDTGLRPVGRVAEIWSELGEGGGPLGYPLAAAIDGASCAWQPFERGTMLWVERRTFLEGCQESASSRASSASPAERPG